VPGRHQARTAVAADIGEAARATDPAADGDAPAASDIGRDLAAGKGDMRGGPDVRSGAPETMPTFGRQPSGRT
jgi:hypothetical protein